jgi:hypothetical protein
MDTSKINVRRIGCGVLGATFCVARAQKREFTSGQTVASGAIGFFLGTALYDLGSEAAMHDRLQELSYVDESYKVMQYRLDAIWYDLDRASLKDMQGKLNDGILDVNRMLATLHAHPEDCAKDDKFLSELRTAIANLDTLYNEAKAALRMA